MTKRFFIGQNGYSDETEVVIVEEKVIKKDFEDSFEKKEDIPIDKEDYKELLNEYLWEEWLQETNMPESWIEIKPTENNKKELKKLLEEIENE